MIRFRLLGSIDLRDRESQEVQPVLAQPKRLALLAYLAAASPPGPHRRDTLLALFWPELDQEHARNALSQAVHFLRRTLGETALVSRNADELAIDETVVWTDVGAFRAALDGVRTKEALDLYRGDLLPSFFVSDAPGFEQWLERERAALRTRAAAAARLLAEQYEAGKHLTLAVACARRALELSDSDERPLRRLIELLHRAGDRAGAVRAYEAFARRLATEFEIDPAPETVALIERIRSSPSLKERTTLEPAHGAPSTLPMTRLGRALADRYKIERQLGAGAMAVVFLAHDLRHHRRVAIKILRPELASLMGPERFLREIDISASLMHPHILPLHDSGEADGLLYYVMPYVEGESLRGRLDRERRLSIADALRIAGEVADALAYAHERGFVHRDIKPENILLGSGHALVADFGIARAIGSVDQAHLGALSLGTGTPAYMSPEQASGDGPVDERTDIYALGCVLFEMLAGEPPHMEGTPEATIERRLCVPAPPVSRFRDEVGPEVDAAIAKALARAPADRFANAAEFAATILGAGQSVPHATAAHSRPPDPRFFQPGVLPDAHQRTDSGGAGRPDNRVRHLIVLVGTLVAMPTAVQLYRGFPSTSGAPIDSDLVVVAPFDVHDPDLMLWREGLVDVLSHGLDGAGRLKTVPPSVTVRRWAGRADRPSATRLAEATGAGVVIFGRVLRRGPDSVSLRATVLDRSAQQAEQELEVMGDEQRMGELADSLGVRTLRALGHARPVGAVRQGTIGSRSLPGLKQFLRGEQFYRRGLWDSALVHYHLAITHDSTFALAISRMAMVLSFNSPTARSYRGASEYRARAFSLDPQLAPRDSLLLAARAWDNVMQDTADAVTLVGARYRVWSILQEAVRRYPRDPEVWYTLGEFRFHSPPPLGRVPSLALEAFERAIDLDPGFGPAYVHTVQLAMTLGRADLARRYAVAYTALDSTNVNTATLRLFVQLLDSGVASPAGRRAMGGVSAEVLFQTGMTLRFWPDSAETTVAMLRELATGRHSLAGALPWVSDSMMWPRYIAGALAFRGHLKPASDVFDPLTLAGDTVSPYRGFEDPFLELALLGIVSDSIAETTFARALSPNASWGGAYTPRYLLGLPWWLSKGDTASLLGFADHATLVISRASPITALRARYLGTAARAYLSLARSDSAEAMQRLKTIPDSLCMVNNCFYEKLTLARLLMARGEDRLAGELLDRWMWSETAIPSFVLANLYRGQIAERLGDREKATAHYRFVMNAWRRPDPQLERYVGDAAAGVKRLDRMFSYSRH
jgi:serine/threonine-protein kinase